MSVGGRRSNNRESICGLAARFEPEGEKGEGEGNRETVSVIFGFIFFSFGLPRPLTAIYRTVSTSIAGGVRVSRFL